MTLVVSLRIPDGIVLAADSLSTAIGTMGIAANIKTKCPKCNNDIELKDLKIPPLAIPSSVQSFAQKLFPFKEKFGAAFFGAGILNNKTIFYHVQNLENEKKKKEYANVSEVANEFKDYFYRELRNQVADLDKAPDDFRPLGFHIVGYDAQEGKTMEVVIGKVPKVNEIKGIGCTVSGERGVVAALWELAKTDPRSQTLFQHFSLQDAIDYAEFLIDTTARYQRFANQIPTVGGEIDIALITPFKKFTWIKRKKLMAILESGKDGA
jgi:20S proteasome alpha/beta subunit